MASPPRSRSTVGRVYNKSLRGLKSIKNLMKPNEEILFSPSRNTDTPSSVPSSANSTPRKDRKLRKSKSSESSVHPVPIPVMLLAKNKPPSAALDVKIPERRFGSEFDDSMVDKEQLKQTNGEVSRSGTPCAFASEPISSEGDIEGKLCNGNNFNGSPIISTLINGDYINGNGVDGNHIGGSEEGYAADISSPDSKKATAAPASPELQSVALHPTEKADSAFGSPSQKVESPNESLIQPFNARWYFKREKKVYGPISGFWMHRLLERECITLSTKCRRGIDPQFWSASTFMYIAGEAPGFFLLPYLGIASDEPFIEAIPAEVMHVSEKKKKIPPSKLSQRVCPLLVERMDMDNVDDEALEKLMGQIAELIDLSETNPNFEPSEFFTPLKAPDFTIRNYEIDVEKRAEVMRKARIELKTDMRKGLELLFGSEDVDDIDDEALEILMKQIMKHKPKNRAKFNTENEIEIAEKVAMEKGIEMEKEAKMEKGIKMEEGAEMEKWVNMMDKGVGKKKGVDKEEAALARKRVDLQRQIYIARDFDIEDIKVDGVFNEVGKRWPGTLNERDKEIVKDVIMETLVKPERK